MKALKLLAVPALALVLNGCAAVTSPVTGFLYSSVKAPMDVTSNAVSTKVGRAKCMSVLGLVATGDASIEAAARSAGITKVHHVDFENFSILGFYATFETVVYGE